ncbi:MAG TPA: KaiC domain-containing protein [Methanoregulaceae archaeon]|nr:KaiC domain-containing protein [Methanoregulaceae archaeon]
MSDTETDELERVRTGITGLDEMLLGGLIRGSIAAIVGSYGTGKTTFGLQFIWEGLCQGETAIYISLEESEESIVRYMRKRGWDPGPYQSSFIVLKLDPTNFNLSINSIRNELPSLIRKFSATRLVFDPISLFEDLFESDAERRYEMFRFVELLRDERCTMVMTSETDRDNPYSSRHNLIEYLADTVILLRHIHPNQRFRAKALEVVKMRRSRHSLETRMYEIGDDRIEVLS